MRVLFDTNVILDVLLDREPHVEASARILYRVENGEVSGWLYTPGELSEILALQSRKG